MENLINFDDCKTTNEYDYFRNVVRNSVSFGICFCKKNTKQKILECYCPTNRVYFETHYKPGTKIKDIVCPNECSCSRVCEFYNANFALKGLTVSELYGKIEKYKDGIVLKKYNVKVDFSAERVSGNFDEEAIYPLERDGEIEVREAERIFFRNDGKTQIFTQLCSIYNPYSGYSMGLSNYFRKASKFPKFSFKYVGGIKEDLKGTSFEKCAECVSDIREVINKQYAFETVDWCLKFITENPSLVKLYQAGFIRVVSDYVRFKGEYGNIRVAGDCGLHFRARKLQKILGVEKSKFDKIDRAIIPLERIGNYICAVKNGAKLLSENEDIIYALSFKELINDFFPGKASEAIKYLRYQSKREKIVYVSMYHDYLRDMRRLGYDTELKEIKFPPHFNAAHDRAVAELIEKEDQINVKSFYTAVIPYSDWKYGDSEKYISPVLTSTELRHWALKFHNCSGGYVERIMRGKCVIFLVRLRSEPLVPYFMFEMNAETGGLVQLFGVRNTPASEDIKTFVNGFIDKYRGRSVAYA